jgi:hypothetical protein
MTLPSNQTFPSPMRISLDTRVSESLRDRLFEAVAVLLLLLLFMVPAVYG